jgi:hypothetical protein
MKMLWVQADDKSGRYGWLLVSGRRDAVSGLYL